MKILIAVHTYYPDQNGVAMVTKYIAEGLAKNNEVFVLTETKGHYIREEVYKNVHIERINVNINMFGFQGEKKTYRKWIKNYNPDIFICVCTQTWTFDWIKTWISHIKCPKILYTHGYSGYMEYYPIWDDLRKGKIRSFVYHLKWKCYYQKAYLYIKKFELAIYLSENNNAVLYAQKYKLENGMILENAVEDRVFEAAERKKIEWGEGTTVRYLYISNYDENKNQEMVLRAFYELNTKNKQLIFVGSQENEYLKKMIKIKNELDQISGFHDVRMLSGLNRNEVVKIMQNSHIFVCSSQKEQYPIVLCEAAVMGMPIITTNVGHAATIPGALIINDQNEMIEKMQYLFDNRKICEVLGEKNKVFSEQHYKINKNIQELEKRIETLNKFFKDEKKR